MESNSQRPISKKQMIVEARMDPVKAGEFILQNKAFHGADGDALLSVFADCVVAAHGAKKGLGDATGSSKWSVTLGWNQSRSSGLFALNFGNDYLCCHSNSTPDCLKVCFDQPALESCLEPGAEMQIWDGYFRLPDSAIATIDVQLARTGWRRLLPAFIANCDEASQAWSKLHKRSYPAHAPGLLEYLRVRLGRSDIPDPGWL